MVRSLVGWIPNDANWRLQQIKKEELEQQCLLRFICTDGCSKSALQDLLCSYHKEEESEKRAWIWHYRPRDPDAYAKALELAESRSFQIIQVQDQSCEDQGGFVKQFTLTSFKPPKGQPSIFIVSFGKYLQCSCRGPSRFPDLNVEICVHTIYIMRHVLNCPEMYRWQVSFLSSERESLLRHSLAARIIGRTGWDLPNSMCTLCFKNLCIIHKTSRGTCERCGRQYHAACFRAAKRQREPAGVDQCCYMCIDRDGWGLEKYREKPNVRPEVKVADAVGSVQPAKPEPKPAAGNAAEQSKKRPDKNDNQDAPDADAAQSSSDEDEDADTTTSQDTCDPVSTVDSLISEIDMASRRSIKLARRYRQLSKEIRNARKEEERDNVRVDRENERIDREHDRKVARLERKNRELRRRIRALEGRGGSRVGRGV